MSQGQTASRREASQDLGADRPWVLSVEIAIKPGRQEEFLGAVNGVLDEMRHEKTFIYTSLCSHPTEPNRFTLFEVWQDRAEFLSVQARRPYREPYRALMEDILAAPFRYKEWYELRADHASHVRR